LTVGSNGNNNLREPFLDAGISHTVAWGERAMNLQDPIVSAKELPRVARVLAPGQPVVRAAAGIPPGMVEDHSPLGHPMHETSRASEQNAIRT
jgi:hypothetical protein